MNPPPAIETLYAAGKWMLDRGRVFQAADIFRALVVSTPGDERAWLGLGACHEAFSQPAIALDLYRMGIASASSSVRCHVARARVLRSLGHDDDAAVALDAAHAAAEESADNELVELVWWERRAA